LVALRLSLSFNVRDYFPNESVEHQDKTTPRSLKPDEFRVDSTAITQKLGHATFSFAQTQHRKDNSNKTSSTGKGVN
jgi:hypothetical protein